MLIPRQGRFVRTDIWREGEWLDLWSVVHFLSGVSIGLGLYFLNLGALASVLLTFVSLVGYEMWEALVKIKETPSNRCMDVVVGMTSFVPSFFFVAPALSDTLLILMFGLVLTANVVLSVFGWQASQKAAVLETVMRQKYAAQRAKLSRRGKRLRESIGR